jgi:hypothetical protein
MKHQVDRRQSKRLLTIAKDLRQAEVGQAEGACGSVVQEVVRLDVPVNDALAVLWW